MSDVNANISVNIDTSAALGELKNLQRQISQFHNQIAKSSASAMIAQRNLQQEFLNSINATGQFAARMQTIKTSAESFTNSLEKNKFSMREYFRYGIASSKNFGKVFKTEFDTINKVAEERVRKLQTQYIKMGRDASGAMKAIAVTPLALDMENLGTKTMIAAQRQQLFNQLLAQGTTNLVNFGKNTQWAGRQLMVGFTVPLSIFGTTASKVFMDLEKQIIRFKRVYGDLFTLPSETEANIKVIRGLADEFTKYGVSIADTMSIAADAAAAGFQGQKLAEQVKAATKLSVLGEVDKQQALSATIAIQTAFKMNSDQLAESINFLNAVENQSVVSLQDLTDAIPKVAPVIQGLGGDIKDMSVFLAAMQEGGVNAAQAANGLKSALASMINPTKAAREMLKGVGIDLNTIVNRNQGNVMRTVLDLAEAMKTLTPLARQRILEQLFGKFQFARVSALFDNIARSGSQAANALALAQMSSQDLAAIANKELSAIEENTMTKFKASIETLRQSIAPVGESFLKVVTPIVEFFTKIADKFNNLSDGSKKVVTTLVALFAGVGPVVLMLVGLIANFGGQMLKLFGLIRNGYLKLTGQSKYLGEQTQYLTNEQMQAEAVAHSLDQVHARLTQRFTIEANAVNNLRNAYLAAVAASERFAFNNPGMMLPQSSQRKGFANGGVVVSGPGGPKDDLVPANLSNGEVVLSTDTVNKNPALVAGLLQGRKINIPGYAANPGSVVGGVSTLKGYGNATIYLQEWLNTLMGSTTGPGAKMTDVLGSLRQSGGAAASPLLAVIARDLMKPLNNPANFKDFQVVGDKLIQAAIVALEGTGKSFVKDIDFETTVVPAMKKAAESLQVGGENIAGALNRAVEEIRTVGMVGVGSASPVGRVAMPGSYKNTAGAAQTFAQTLNPEVFQKQVVPSKSAASGFKNLFRMKDVETDSFTTATMAHIAPSITANIQELELKMGAYIKGAGVRLQAIAEKVGTTIGYKTTQAIKRGAMVNSPSDATQDVGQEIDNGLIVGMEQNAPLVRAAAERVANQALIGMRNTGLLDKNGKPIFVPEIGTAPTQGSNNSTFLGMPSFPKKTLRQKYDAFRSKPIGDQAKIVSGGAMKYGMIASGATLAASMMPGQIGQLAQSIMPAVMGLQSLAMVLPMLTNPLGLAVAGVAALAAGFFFLRKKQQEYIKSLEDAGKKEAEARLGSIDSINAYSRYIGDKALPSERQFNRQGDRRFIDADLAKAASFRKFYQEEGKAVGAQLSGRAGKANALDVTAKDVAKRAATFGLGPADIAANIKAAAELSGVNEIDLKGKVKELLSPDGKDITKEPLSLDARINYLSKESESSLAVIQRKINQIKPPQLQKDTYGNVDYYGYSGEVQKSKETQIKNTKFATVGLTLALEDQKNALAILNGMYVDGKITVDQYNAAYEAQMINFRNIKKATDDLVISLDKVDPSGKASQAAIADMADQTFKSLEKTNKKVAKLLKETVTKNLPKNMRTEVLVAYANGSLSVTDILQLESILSEMKGKTYKEKVEFVAKLTGISDALRYQLEYYNSTERLSNAQEKYNRAKQKGSKDLATYKKNLDDAKGSVEKLKKAIEEGGKATKDSPQVPGTTDTKDSSTGTNPYAFIDDLLKKFKQVKNNSVDATKGVGGFIKALKGDPTGYKGTDELLRASGATQGFIDIVGGLDAKTFKSINGVKGRLFKLGKDGKFILGDLGQAINKFSKEIEMASFVDQQQQVAKNAEQQVTVYNKLAGSGLSAAKIIEIMGNEALVAALAAEKVNSQDFKNFIAGAKKADANVKELAKTLKITAFQDAQEKETAADKMNQYFAAQEAIIKLNARNAFKAEQGMSPEKYQEKIDAQQVVLDNAQKELQAEQDKIDLIQQEVALYNRGLDLIGREEDKINKAYDERSKAIEDQISALEDVKKVNQQLIDQQKQQTDLAGALSSGDIGAAARIAQEMRANASQNSQQTLIDNLGKQKTALELKKQKDLAAIQVEINGQKYTRTQLQDLIVQKEDQIYLAEQTTLKAAQDKVDLQDKELKKMQEIIDKYNKDMTLAINNVTNATGQTKAEWDTVQTAVETVTEWLGDAHMLGIMDDVAAGVLTIEDAWKKVLAAIQAAVAAQSAFGSFSVTPGGGGGGGGGTTNPGNINIVNSTVATETETLLDAIKAGKTSTITPSQIANEMATSLLSDKKATAALGGTAGVLSSARYTGQAIQYAAQQAAAQYAADNPSSSAALAKLTSGQTLTAAEKRVLGMSTGGLVPKYFVAGGYAKGTDTVPAMLTPGEFVMSKYAVDKHGVGTLNAMNNGKTAGDSVYTYNLSVNVKSDANPNEIARTVMAQIKQIDSQRIRGVRK